MEEGGKSADRGRLWPLLPALAYMGLIFFVSSLSLTQTRLPRDSDKLIHFVEYGVLAALWVFALRRTRGGRTRSVRVQAAWSFAISSLYGVTDEIHQLFVPHRSASVADWIADTVGAGLVAAIVLLAGRDRK